MSQNTIVVVDGTGLEVLGYINDALNTAVTCNSGASEPSEKYALMLWADTTNNVLKIRNEANSAWLSIGSFDADSFDFTIGDGTVTTAKIVDANVTSAKLATGAAVANIETGTITSTHLASNSVTTAKIQDGSVTSAKLSSLTIDPAKLSTGGPSWTSSGVFSFNSGYGSNAPAYGCRAWVNFNGTGVISIRSSANVSSITDGGAGYYEINFSTPMPDTNYCITGSNRVSGYASVFYPRQEATLSTSSVAITSYAIGASSVMDAQYVNVAIFR